MGLNDNEIVCIAYPVKYHDIEYYEDYIVLTQNRTKRRVKKGYYFEDTGVHIYLSDYVASIFQHKKRQRKFILNMITKEFLDYATVKISIKTPAKIEFTDVQPIKELER